MRLVRLVGKGWRGAARVDGRLDARRAQPIDFVLHLAIGREREVAALLGLAADDETVVEDVDAE